MKNKKKYKIGASMLACDFGAVAEEAARAEKAGVDSLHLDIMDGHFVKNISFGPAFVAAVKASSSLFLDVHLMIYNPHDYIKAFVAAGADRITFHYEAYEKEETLDTLQFIRTCGKQAGLALCPENDPLSLLPYQAECDLFLLMTVNPGFGGRAFLPEILPKIAFLRKALGENFPIQVDGGINDKTAALAAQSGATDFVAGTYLFKEEEMDLPFKKLQAALGALD